MPGEELNPKVPVSRPQGSDEEMLNELLSDTFPYFINQVNPVNGLVADKTKAGSPASIAVVGFALSCYVIAIERGLLTRKEGIDKTRTILSFFYNSPQGTGPEAMGYNGFYYHFLDMQTGLRAWQSELSTIDTALFIAGALSSAAYFTNDTKEEAEIRELADQLYRRINWQWACNGSNSLTHGWNPESGFLPYRWNKNLSEAHLLYILAMASPTFPIDTDCYQQWIKTFEWIKAYEIEYCYSGPLFIHQFMHLWLDLEGLYDNYNRQTGIDYFENSRRATHVHRQYAVENKKKFKHYNLFSWGFTASDGPGPARKKVNGSYKYFYDYKARGAPFGPDDGTVSPWAVVGSLPFAPEIVLPTLRHAIERLRLKSPGKMGFDASFNATFPEKGENPYGWVSPWRFGLNEGPTIMMIDNYQNGLLWKIMKKSPYIIAGLRCAGFTGGWLDTIPKK
jgi:hypothetical protein